MLFQYFDACALIIRPIRVSNIYTDGSVYTLSTRAPGYLDTAYFILMVGRTGKIIFVLLHQDLTSGNTGSMQRAV